MDKHILRGWFEGTRGLHRQIDALSMRRKVARSKVSLIETGPFMDTYFGWENIETRQSRKCEEEDKMDRHIFLVDCPV